MARISSWRDLVVWKKAHELALLVYKLTKDFPSDEKFGLSSQMRRAAVSIASNIVEGFKRRTVKDSVSFYNISDGSLEELRYQLLLSYDLGYISKTNYQSAEQLALDVSRLLYAWSKSQRENIRRSS
jgi:four helix bundle protein